MTPRIQADADFNHKIVLALRRREPAIKFTDAHHAGVIGMPDSDVLQISSNSGRILISHDRKTMPAYFAQFVQDHSRPGLVIVEQNVDIAAAVEDLLLIWAATDAEEWRDQIGFLPL